MLFSIKFTNTCPISPGDYTASSGGSQVKLDDKSVTFLTTKMKANKDMRVDTQSAYCEKIPHIELFCICIIANI